MSDLKLPSGEAQAWIEFERNTQNFAIWKEQVQMDAIMLPKKITKWESGGVVELTRFGTENPFR